MRGAFRNAFLRPRLQPQALPGGEVVARDIQLDADLSPHHRAQVLQIKEILSERDIDVSGLHGTPLKT